MHATGLTYIVFSYLARIKHNLSWPIHKDFHIKFKIIHIKFPLCSPTRLCDFPNCFQSNASAVWPRSRRTRVWLCWVSFASPSVLVGSSSRASSQHWICFFLGNSATVQWRRNLLRLRVSTFFWHFSKAPLPHPPFVSAVPISPLPSVHWGRMLKARFSLNPVQSILTRGSWFPWQWLIAPEAESVQRVSLPRPALIVPR